MRLGGASVLVTGGTGSFGRPFCAHLLTLGIDRLVVYSRDEHKQWEMARSLDDGRMRYFIGDVRDRERLYRAMEDVDVVVHAAAMKHVPVCESNPFEAVKTNIVGTQNVVDAAIDRGVHRVVALSSDKAAAPCNLYGATKLAAEKIVTSAGNYAGGRDIRFAAVRYGNVLGSRGSVVPLFLEQRDTGRLTITDERMTRFTMTVAEAVALVERAIASMKGGEVFVSRCKSYRVTDVAKAIAPDAEHVVTGIRPGEQLHETLVSEAEALYTHKTFGGYVIGQTPDGDGERYSSDDNDFLTVEEIRSLVDALEPASAEQRDGGTPPQDAA